MRRLLTDWIFLIVLSPMVHAEEYIDTYHVEIEILKNGNVSVSEKIRFWAEGDKNSGFARHFSLKNVEKYQRSSCFFCSLFSKSPYFNFKGTHDGNNIPGKILNSKESFAYLFGRPEKFGPSPLLKDKFHNFLISYEVDRAILQFKESDQLYWNVIPFYWEYWKVPIKNVSATVNFPESAEYLGTEVFSGKFGSKANELDVSYFETGSAIKLHGANFKPEQGVTVRIKFQPELIESYKPRTLIDDHIYYFHKEVEDDKRKRIYLIQSYIILLVTLAIVAAVYFSFYKLRSKNHALTNVAPKFYPPRNISPLAARFILRRGNIVGPRMIGFALISLATKGAVELRESKIILLKGASISERAEKIKIFTEEWLVLRNMGLLEVGDEFEIEQSEKWSNNLREIGYKLEDSLERQFGANMEPAKTAQTFFYVVTTIMLIWALSVAILGIFWAAFWIWFEIFSIGFLMHQLTISISKLKTHTKLGRQNLSQLMGLELYIKTPNLNSLRKEPEPNASQFSTIYPYALSMGFAVIWAKKFANQISSWQTSNNGEISWYFDNQWKSFMENFVAAASYDNSGSGPAHAAGD